MERIIEQREIVFPFMFSHGVSESFIYDGHFDPVACVGNKLLAERIVAALNATKTIGTYEMLANDCKIEVTDAKAN